MKRERREGKKRRTKERRREERNERKGRKREQEGMDRYRNAESEEYTMIGIKTDNRFTDNEKKKVSKQIIMNIIM